MDPQSTPATADAIQRSSRLDTIPDGEAVVSFKVVGAESPRTMRRVVRCAEQRRKTISPPTEDDKMPRNMAPPEEWEITKRLLEMVATP